MKAKDYFRRVSQARELLTEYKWKRAQLMDRATDISAHLSGVLGARQTGGSKVESAAISLADSDRDMDPAVEQCRALMTAAEELIDQVDNPRYRRLLKLRYLHGWSWTAISNDLGYTDRSSIYHAHGWALAALQKKML